MPNGYWTEGKIDPRTNTNVGGGTFVPSTSPAVISAGNVPGYIESNKNKLATYAPAPVTTNNGQNGSDALIEQAKSRGGVTPSEAKALGINLDGYALDPSGLYIPRDVVSEKDKTNQDYNDQISNMLRSIEGSIRDQGNTTVAGIKDLYKSRMNDLTTVNADEQRKVARANLLTGASRYTPGNAAHIISDAERSGIDRLTKLGVEEQSLINQANEAMNNKLYAVADKKMALLDKIRLEKSTAIQDQYDAVAKQNEVIKKNNIQASRDAAVADLVNQGITDPSQILDMLSYDNNGNPTNGGFTADEVSKTLKALSPGGDLSKLSGSVRDFYILKNQGKLPGDIQSLPEEDQLFSYLKSVKDSTRAPGAGPKKITFSYASSKGLPLLTVGMTEDELAQSFYKEEPPAWFVEKMQTENKMSFRPDVIQASWDEYRQSIVNSGSSSSKDKSPTATVIGNVRKLKNQHATDEDIHTYISESGYNPDDPAFK